MQILFVGDVMLGRLVNNVLPKENFKYVWGNTIEIIQKADFSLLNLECAISSKGKEWKKTFKVFHFRANPNAIKVLKSASIDYVALANNHILDYDVEGLVDTIDLLDKYNISHSGAGKDLKNATKPAFIEKKIKINQDKHKKLNVKKYENIKDSIRIGLISLTDNQPEWEAYPNSPGVNYIPLTLQQNIYSDRLENSILEAKKQSDLVIVASHVGPHFREMPSNTYVNFAHKIIDFGADIYWGHSNHTPQGIEIYKKGNNQKIILYDCGDFIDDYATDPNYRNDLSFIFLLNFHPEKNLKSSNSSNNQSNMILENCTIELIPTKIRNFRVNSIPLNDGDIDLIINRMAERCLCLGTNYSIDEKKKRIRISL